MNTDSTSGSEEAVKLLKRYEINGIMMAAAKYYSTVLLPRCAELRLEFVSRGDQRYFTRTRGTEVVEIHKAEDEPLLADVFACLALPVGGRTFGFFMRSVKSGTRFKKMIEVVPDSTALATLRMPARCSGTLYNMGFQTLGELDGLRVLTLRQQKNFGGHSLNQLVRVLDSVGFYLVE